MFLFTIMTLACYSEPFHIGMTIWLFAVFKVIILVISFGRIKLGGFCESCNHL